jgi:hypothetical protein
MPIELDRTEVLTLMQELPSEHFLQPRLLDELVRMNQVQTPVTPPRRSITEQRRDLEKTLGIREVVNGQMVVKKMPHGLMAEFLTDAEHGKGEYTDKQLDEMYEAGGIAPLKQCKWQTYGHQCRNESKNEFCDDHINEICSHRDAAGVRCGHKADHGCPTELQFVCGAPCCSEHSNCGNHRLR